MIGIVVTLLLALVAVNDANWVSFGGAGAFAPHKTVHMLGEDISITVFDDKTHVRVYFSFENKGPATTVEMAFPFEDTGQSMNATPFPNFATKVDGEPVAVKRVTTKPFTRIGEEFKEQGYDLARPFVYVKEVEFAENQRRTVLVDYTALNGFGGSGWVSNEYILRTGATWAGKIGHCTVTVDWTKTKAISKPSLQFLKQDGKLVPSTWTYLSARKATCTLTDFEPDFDLSLTSIKSFWNVTINGEQLGPDRGIAGSSGPLLTGEPSDPFIYEFGLLDFFWESGNYRSDYVEGKVANAFGNFLDVTDASTVRDGLGRKLRLSRSVESFGEYESKLRLKDLVEALGGTFKWNGAMERVDITLPTRDKPIKREAGRLSLHASAYVSNGSGISTYVLRSTATPD